MSNIDPTVELSIWEDMQRKYIKQHDDLSRRNYTIRNDEEWM